MKPQDQSGDIAKNPPHLAPIFNLFGIIGVSIPAHLIITPAINVGGKRVKENASYPTALKESLSRPLGIQLQDTSRIMQRRILASMLPAIASKEIVREFEWPLSALMPLNAIFETVIGSKLEPREKFSSVNSAKYPLIYPLQPGHLISTPANILKINREEFFSLLPNNHTTKNYGEAEWQDLSSRQKIFAQNYYERAAALFCRNLSFCAASVVAGPLATKFVNQHQDKIEKAGIDIKHADYAATLLCRMFFAWMTTPFDSLVTRLSAGDLTSKQVMAEALQNIKARNVSSFFAGAAARTILATTTSTTVALGSRAGKHIEEFLENISEEISNNPFYKILSPSSEKIFGKTLEEASKYATELTDKIIKDPSKVTPAVEVLESVKNLPEADKIKTSLQESESTLVNFGEALSNQKNPSTKATKTGYSSLQEEKRERDK